MNGIVFNAGCLYISVLTSFAACYEENCDYLDKSRKDRTSHLQCYYGCCGEFKTRHCCSGPIVIVGAVFGSLVTILILGALIAVCYGKYKRGETIRKTRPSNRTGTRGNIPEPTPPLPTPHVYRLARLYPPPIITKSKFLLKTPVPPTDTNILSSKTSDSVSSSHKDTSRSPHSTSVSFQRPIIQPVLNSPTTRFQDIPESVKERVFNEHHPPPSELHPPRLTPRK